MIEKIHIQNFKSIRVNLFIGENGSGKSNLLEALVFVSASESNKLDNEFLVSRGLRVPEPQLMRSAFFEEDRETIEFKNENSEYSKWENIQDELLKLMIMVLNGKKEIHESTVEAGISLGTQGLSEIEKNELLEYQKMDSIKLTDFIIYSPEHEVLRNFYNEGQIQPLGVKGEGLYKLLKVVNNYEDKNYIQTIIESLETCY